MNSSGVNYYASVPPSYLQWFPYTIIFQALFLLWRWGVFCYFFSWLITVGYKSNVSTFFTFLTIWSFLAYNVYLFVAAISVSVEFIRINILKSRARTDLSHNYKIVTEPPKGCCGYSDNNISWYLSVHWFFFLLGNMFAVTIPLLYWPLLYRGGHLNAEDIHVHLLNGVFAFADVVLSGIPIHAWHVVYLMVFGCVYSLFSGLYFVGTQDIIYPVLNYGQNVGGAVVTCLAVIFLIIPIIYFVVFFAMYRIKLLILYRIWGSDTNEYERLSESSSPMNNYDTFPNETTPLD